MKIYEQADSGTNGPIYSWILDARYRCRKALDGWKWVSGRPGCFVTNNRNLAQAAAQRFGLAVESNGTHAVTGSALTFRIATV